MDGFTRLYKSSTLSRLQKSGGDGVEAFKDSKRRRRESIRARGTKKSPESDRDVQDEIHGSPGTSFYDREQYLREKEESRYVKRPRHRTKVQSHGPVSSPPPPPGAPPPLQSLGDGSKSDGTEESVTEETQQAVLDAVLRQREEVHAFMLESKERLEVLRAEAERTETGAERAVAERIRMRASGCAEAIMATHLSSLSHDEEDAVTANVLRMRVANQEQRLREKEELLGAYQERAKEIVAELGAAMKETKSIRLEEGESIKKLRERLQVLEEERDELSLELGKQKKGDDVIEVGEDAEDLLGELKDLVATEAAEKANADGMAMLRSFSEETLRQALEAHARDSRKRVSRAAASLNLIADECSERTLGPILAEFDGEIAQAHRVAIDAEANVDAHKRNIARLLDAGPDAISKGAAPLFPIPSKPPPNSLAPLAKSHLGTPEEALAEIDAIRAATISLWKSNPDESFETIEDFLRAVLSTSALSSKKQRADLLTAISKETTRNAANSELQHLKDRLQAAKQELAKARRSKKLHKDEFRLVRAVSEAEAELAYKEALLEF